MADRCSGEVVIDCFGTSMGVPVEMNRDRAHDAAGPEPTGLALAGSGCRWLRLRRTA